MSASFHRATLFFILGLFVLAGALFWVIHQPHQDPALRGSLAPSAIRISVTDQQTKRPLPQADVSFLDNNAARVIADTQGSAVLTLGQEDVGKTIVIHHDGYIRQFLTFTPSAQIQADYSVALAPGSAVGGKVVDRDQKPVPGATVTVVSPQKGGTITGTATTNSDGYWEFHDLPPEFVKISLHIEHPRFTAYTSADPVAPADLDDLRQMKNITQIAAKTTVHGKLTLASGQPAAGAIILVTKPATNLLFNNSVASTPVRFTAQPDGTYEFDPPERPFRAVVTHDQGYAAALSDDLAENADLKLRPWAGISGTLFIDGSPAAGQRVNCRVTPILSIDESYAKVAWNFSTQTDTQGRFTFTRLPAFQATISYQSLSVPVFPPETYESQVDLIPGKEAHVTLAAPGDRVNGKVLLPVSWNGSIPSGGQIVFEPDLLRSNSIIRAYMNSNGQKTYDIQDSEEVPATWPLIRHRRNIPLQPNGTFTADAMPPGNYHVFCILPAPSTAAPTGFAVYTQDLSVQSSAEHARDVGTWQMHAAPPLGPGTALGALALLNDKKRPLVLPDLTGKVVVLVFSRMNGRASADEVDLFEFFPAPKDAARCVIIAVRIGPERTHGVPAENQRWIEATVADEQLPAFLDRFNAWDLPATCLFGPDSKWVAGPLHDGKKVRAALSDLLAKTPAP